MRMKFYSLGVVTILLIAGCGQNDVTPTPTATLKPAPTAVPTETAVPAQPSPQPTETASSEAGGPVEEKGEEAAPEPDTPEVTQFELEFNVTECPFTLPPDEAEDATVTCGYVTVPEDRSSSDDASLRLAVVVFSARSSNPQPDPVILLAGGPGEKTVQNASNVALILDLFRDDRDLILFDQRGVGLSEPALECPEFTAAILDILDELDPEIGLKNMYDAVLSCGQRLEAEGLNLSAFNTTENAADVDAIRQALGYEQLNLYGGSYGSQLAQAVMRDHPDAIRSVTLGAVLPLNKSFFVHVPLTVVDATLHLLDSCAADEACNSAYPDLKQTLYDTIDQLNADPIPLTITNPLDGQSYDSWLSGDEIFGNLATFLYITDIIPVLPKAINDVAQGDYELMTQLSSTKLALLDALSRGMLYSVFCAEDLIGVSPEDFLETRSQMPPALAGSEDPEDIIEYGFFGICQDWPVEAVDPAFKEPVRSDIPTLILEGEFDPVTPLVYAEEVAQYLTKSYLYEFPAIGHNVLVSSFCAQDIADQFMADPSLEPNASCLAEMPPVTFDLPEAEVGEIVLEEVADLKSGLSGLAPTGWESPAPGTYVRGENALDSTALVVDLLPMGMEDFLDLITARLTLAENPTSVGERETEGFSWTLYSEEVQGVAVDMAVVAIDEGRTLMVLLQQPAGERDVLYEAVFLPVVDALRMEE